MQRARLLRVFLLSVVFAGMAGCATTGERSVRADKASIEQIQRIGVYTWRGQPSYYQNTGGGIPGAAYSILQKAYSAASGDRSNTILAISNSGVYETFEQQFVQRFSALLSKDVEILSKDHYIYTGSDKDRRLDAMASARAQGYDALLEITAWPSLNEFTEQMNVRSPVSYEATLSIHLTLTRLADAKALWNTSYKTWKKGRNHAPGFKTELVPTAVDYGIKQYLSGK